MPNPVPLALLMGVLLVYLGFKYRRSQWSRAGVAMLVAVFAGTFAAVSYVLRH